jgi:hypothetical protein
VQELDAMGSIVSQGRIIVQETIWDLPYLKNSPEPCQIYNKLASLELLTHSWPFLGLFFFPKKSISKLYKGIIFFTDTVSILTDTEKEQQMKALAILNITKD